MIVEENPEAKLFTVDLASAPSEKTAIKRADLKDRDSDIRKLVFHVGSNNWIAGAK